MTKRTPKDPYALSEKYPNIRVIDSDAVAMLSDGTSSSIAGLGFKTPLLVLHRDELNRASMQRLLPFYKGIYADSRRLEHRATYDALTEKIYPDTDAFTQKRSDWFDTMFIGTDNVHSKNYVESPIEERDTFLGNRHDVEYRQTHKQQWLSWAREQIATRDEEFPDDTDTRRESRRLLVNALDKVDPDFLVLLNSYRTNIMAGETMGEIDGESAEGISYPTNGFIKLSRAALVNPLDLDEEIIHHIDGMEGFTCRIDEDDGKKKGSKWINAANKEYNVNTTRLMMDFIDEVTGKTSLFEKGKYQRSQIPSELLPDLYRADQAYDRIIECIRQRARGEFPKPEETREVIEAKALLKRAQSDSTFAVDHTQEISKAKLLLHNVDKNINFDHTQDIADANSLLRIIDLKHNHGDKDLVMSELFPTTWPMYKEFMQKVHDKAQDIRLVTGQLSDRSWANDVLSQPRNGVTPVKDE